jgi:hypothetical protein
VVPDENRMLVVASASHTTASNASALPPAAAAAASPACESRAAGNVSYWRGAAASAVGWMWDPCGPNSSLG